MKIMSKLKIIRKNSIKNILNEKRLLSKLHFPFLVNMVLSFQDIDNLYLIMDLLLGGDLRYHLNKGVVYNEEQLKLILSCTILGLDYLHNKEIIHKDIKPENLVFDSNGYIHITDLGISKIYHEDNKKENSGTPWYMAPEVLFNRNHDYSVDFFALGVVGYEIIMGRRPYDGKDKKELRRDVASRQAKIKDKDLPSGWTKKCADFINGLIQRRKELRLGYRSILEIKNHPWFEDFNWNDLLNKKIKCPWKPPYEENYYHDLNRKDEVIGKETELLYKQIKQREEYSKYFEDYTFNETDLIKADNKFVEKNKEYNHKIKLKYDITSKIVNKLKEEIKRITFSSFNFIPIDKKSNSLYKTKFSYTKFNSKRADNKNGKRNENSSLRLTKSYYLYNFRNTNKDINLKMPYKYHINNNFNINNDSYSNQINHLSTKYNSIKKKNLLKEKIKSNNNSNESNYFYNSIYPKKFFGFQQGEKRIKLKLTSMKDFINFNKMTQGHLPLIRQIKKSSSVGNFNRYKYSKTSKINIDNEHSKL